MEGLNALNQEKMIPMNNFFWFLTKMEGIEL